MKLLHGVSCEVIPRQNPADEKATPWSAGSVMLAAAVSAVAMDIRATAARLLSRSRVVGPGAPPATSRAAPAPAMVAASAIQNIAEYSYASGVVALALLALK